MTEVRTADLRFTRAEAAAFLTGMLNIPMDDATVELLDEKTEGWAAGLRLVGLYLRDRDDIGKSVQDLSGSSR
jgi:LuxR family maltose regulon positive regulatory protein